MQEKLNNYLLKLTGKDRAALIQLSKIKNNSLAAEQGLRALLEQLAQEVKDEK
jgi:hypothetical protein